jgi:hypothetical protein
MRQHKVFGLCILKSSGLSQEARHFQGLQDPFERMTDGGNTVVDAVCEDGQSRTLLARYNCI